MEKTDAEPQISTLNLGPVMASTGTGRGETRNKSVEVTSFSEAGGQSQRGTLCPGWSRGEPRLEV